MQIFLIFLIFAKSGLCQQQQQQNGTFFPKADDDDCDFGPDPDAMNQDEFTSKLTDPCRYDRVVKPLNNGNGQPLNVSLLIDMRHIEAIDQLQFKMHMLVQYRYMDSRLSYETISPKRGRLIGEAKLRDKIWIPHIIIANERDTSIMGVEGKDMFVSISPDGEVIYSYRMTAITYCWMDLKKFPFDVQLCSVHFRSWTYNTSNLILLWGEDRPVSVATQLHLTEFKLTKHYVSSGTVNASLARGGHFGEYSNLVFSFRLAREIGFYIMDYFIPSILLVATSWVTFWLQADNTAPRVTLGTSTMLSFITLASGQSKSLPKVSYIKANEIWFLACTMFIFASMAEFAFVNIIWRRKKKVELKKVNSKYILKCTITPKLARKELERSHSTQNLHKSHSCATLYYGAAPKQHTDNNYLTVNNYNSMGVPTITMQSEDDLLRSRRTSNDSTLINMNDSPSDDELGERARNGITGGVGVGMETMWTTMTPQEIACWIDKRSRLAFPTAFFIFNIFYWSFVYLL